MAHHTPRHEFLELIARPEELIDLADGALLIAREEYPTLDAARYRSILDDLAVEARPLVSRARGNPFGIIDALNTVLFEQHGFRGDPEGHSDPRNSFLNDVMDRRRGIPVTLSILYMEVSARVGFELQGVGFPGHFLVRHSGGGRDIMIDPFCGGRILDVDDCRLRLRRFYGEGMPLEPRFLAAVGKKQILARILINLKRIYIERVDHGRALATIDRLLALDPDDPCHLRDRGGVHLRMSRLGSASQDLEAYLKLAPRAADRPAVVDRLRKIRRLTAMLN